MSEQQFHRDDLIRMVTIPKGEVEFRASEGDGLGTLEGYAAVFNEDTTIDSWEGHFVERIAPGAFAKTLRDRRDKVKVLFNHGFDPQIGDKPLGKPRTMTEDKRGLRVEVPLDDTSYNRDLVASLRSGALDGMSFRFSVVREEIDDADEIPIRTLREVKLYEFGPVTFPAYEATTAGVRAREAYQVWRAAQRENGGPVSKGAPLEVGSSGPEMIFPPEVLQDIDQKVEQISEAQRAEDTTVDSDAADSGTSEDRDDTPPVEAPVEETQEAEPAFEMPVRRLDEDALRQKAQKYVERAAALR